MLSPFFPPTGSQESQLCPIRTLRIYIDHPASYRMSEQLFVSFDNRAKGGPVTKQRISRWLVDAITLVYSSSWMQCPIRVRAHYIRGIASSWAWSSGVSISDICEAYLDVLDVHLFRFTWPTLFKPLFAWSFHNCMDARYHFRDDTQATGDSQDTKKGIFPYLQYSFPYLRKPRLRK